MSPSSRASVVPAPQPTSLSAPRIKRKKSAFAIGLAKLVPSVLRKSSVAVKSEQLVASSSSLSSLIPQYYTLPQPLSSSSHARIPFTPSRILPRRRQTDRQASSSSPSVSNPPRFVRPPNFRVATAHMGRTFSDSQVLTGTTPWVRGVDGYVTSTGPPTPLPTRRSERPLPALPAEAGSGSELGRRPAATFRRWVSESAPVAVAAAGKVRQRVISASSVVEDAARKVENGRLTPWEDATTAPNHPRHQSADGTGGAAGVGGLTESDLSETVVWEVATEREVVEVEGGRQTGEGAGGSDCGSVRGTVVYGSEEEGEDAFVYSHHLAPSSTTSTSFDLSPWTFPSPPSHAGYTHSLPSRGRPGTWVRPTWSPFASPGHSPASSISRYSIAQEISSVHSSYAGSGYAVSMSFSSQMREGEEDDEEEEEVRTPQMGAHQRLAEEGGGEVMKRSGEEMRRVEKWSA